MSRRFLALLALAPLLACTPPSSDDAMVPLEAPRRPDSHAPKPARERAPANSPRKDTLQAGSGYYQYVDESGRVRFASSLDQVPERQRSTAGHISVESSVARPSHQRAEVVAEARVNGQTTNAEVVLYTTQSCGYCKKARAYFDRIGQDYVDKDVEHDDDAREEFLHLTHGNSGVPVIVIGDQMIQGWSQPRVEKMLAATR